MVVGSHSSQLNNLWAVLSATFIINSCSCPKIGPLGREKWSRNDPPDPRSKWALKLKDQDLKNRAVPKEFDEFLDPRGQMYCDLMQSLAEHR